MRIRIKDFIPYPWQVLGIQKLYTHRMLLALLGRQLGKSKLGLEVLINFLMCNNIRKHPSASIFTLQLNQALRLYFYDIKAIFQKYMDQGYCHFYSSNTKGSHFYFERPWLKDFVILHYGGTRNPDTVRGGTRDLLFLDEFSFYNDDVFYFQIYPMVSQTFGKVMITSTVNGENNFTKLLEEFTRKEAEGSRIFSSMEYTTWNGGARKYSMTEADKAVYIAGGKLHVFEREYENSRTAGEVEEFPFSKLVKEVSSGVFPFDGFFYDQGEQVLNLVHDIGTSTGAMSVWGYIRNRFGVYVIYFDDSFSSVFDSIVKNFQRFGNHFRKIRLVYPHDAGHPAVKDGTKLIKSVKDFISLKRWNLRFQVAEPLERVQSKSNLFRDGRAVFGNLKWILDEPGPGEVYGLGVKRGLKKLGSCQFKKDAQGIIQDGVMKPNGSQHCTDSYLYLSQDARRKVVGMDLPQDHSRGLFSGRKGLWLGRNLSYKGMDLLPY